MNSKYGVGLKNYLKSRKLLTCFSIAQGFIQLHWQHSDRGYYDRGHRLLGEKTVMLRRWKLDLEPIGKSVKSYIIQNGGTDKPWALCKLNSGNFWLGRQICERKIEKN